MTKKEKMLVNPNSKLSLDMINILKECVLRWNNGMMKHTLSGFKFHPYNYIPLRNKSGGVAEGFAGMFCSKTDSHVENPHEDGYPDILPNNEEAIHWIETPTLKDFKGKGGFDMKSVYVKDKVDTNASAHHQKTTCVMNVIWIFENNVPKIIGITYADNLTKDDWGTPTMGKKKSKTTPSCSVNKFGKRKLRVGWVLMEENLNLVQKEDWLGYP